MSILLPKLNLPNYQFKVKTVNQRTEIFDIIRKKFVVLSPEEWVRQHFIHFLITEKKYPASLFLVEKGMKLDTLSKRTDILIYSATTATPFMLIECKAPDIKIKQDVFEQAGSYNLKQKVNFIVVTNGLEHYCCKMDYNNNSFEFIAEIPEYKAKNAF